MRDLRSGKFAHQQNRNEQRQIENLRNHPHVPVDFNWKEYLSLYPSLAKKGITTEYTALRHWIKVGVRAGNAYKKQDGDFFEIDETPETVNIPHNSDDVKILSFYLPACYPFAENNEFWGEGFTEWTNINKWTPFYEGHEVVKGSDVFGQYDLRDFEVRQHHARLAAEAGIHGFVFYHYWFSQHPKKKVMYEVLEKLLEDGEPNMPFCLEWANEPWTKKWDGLEHEYLIKQEYGSEDDHQEHFNYLNRFFSHENYIKVNEMPVLCIYRIGHIQDFKNLKDSYNRLAKAAGYPGIYFVELLNHFNDNGGKFNPEADAYAEYHPMYVNSLYGFKELPISTENAGVYDTVEKWKFLAEEIKVPKEKIKGKPYYRGMFVGWDNSPRATGRRAGIDGNNSPTEFGKYLKKQIENVKQDPENPEKFLFLFAWNEWGEGAVVESSDLYKNEYLTEVRKAVIGDQYQKAEIEDIKNSFNFSLEKSINKQKTAIFLHVYYTELLENILERFQKIKAPFDLFINLVEEKYTEDIANLISEKFPKARLLLSQNYGRDWAGYYRLSKAVNLDDYDTIFLAHSKRTFRKGKPTRDHEREYFLDTFFGSTERFEDIVNLIRHNDSGIVASVSKIMHEDYSKSDNSNNTKLLFDKHGYEFNRNIKIEFSYGSIFAIHSSILKKIFSKIYLNEFERIEKIDGLLPHSLERFPFYFCNKENIKISYIEKDDMSYLKEAKRKKIFVVSHDTSLTGAPMVAFRVAEKLAEDTRYNVSFVTMRSDVLEKLDVFKNAKFEYKYCNANGDSYENKVSRVVDFLSKEKPDFIYINSAASFSWVSAAKKLAIPHILNVLEMKGAVLELRAHKQIPPVPYRVEADNTFFVSKETFNDSKDLLFASIHNYQIVPNCINVDYVLEKAKDKEQPATNIHGQMINYEKEIICSCGDGTYRKGLDVFLNLASKNPDKQFLWIGCNPPNGNKEIINKNWVSVSSNVFFTGKIENPYYHMYNSDIFLLTSREDPMPLVVIEAAAMGMFTVSFAESGGSFHITERYGKCLPGSVNVQDLDEFIKTYTFSKKKNSTTMRCIKKQYDVPNMIDPVNLLIQKTI